MKYKVEVDRAAEMVRKEMLLDPGPLIPRLYAFPPLASRFPPLASFGLRGLHDSNLRDDVLFVPFDPSLMVNWRSKNLIGTGIVILSFRVKARVTVFFSDALRATPAPGKTFSDYPRNFNEWPKSLTRESLLVFVNAIGMMGYALSYSYTRDGKGRRVFDSEPETNLEDSRFCYDLTDATEESALLDALHRDRNGKLEASA